jgi:hypothetical protein
MDIVADKTKRVSNDGLLLLKQEQETISECVFLPPFLATISTIQLLHLWYRVSKADPGRSD